MSEAKNKLISARLEDYLEAFYEINAEKNGVKAIDISKKLNVQRSSVTDALKSLSEKGLVNYGRYDVISLTPKGEELAKNVIDKHKKLYYFFHDILGVDSIEADETACYIEHVISDNVLNKLLAYIEKRWFFLYAMLDNSNIAKLTKQGYPWIL